MFHPLENYLRIKTAQQKSELGMRPSIGVLLFLDIANQAKIISRQSCIINLHTQIPLDIYSYFSHSEFVPFHRGLAHDGDQGGRGYGPVAGAIVALCNRFATEIILSRKVESGMPERCGQCRKPRDGAFHIGALASFLKRKQQRTSRLCR